MKAGHSLKDHYASYLKDELLDSNKENHFFKLQKGPVMGLF
jgi:hypothetical protein